MPGTCLGNRIKQVRVRRARPDAVLGGGQNERQEDSADARPQAGQDNRDPELPNTRVPQRRRNLIDMFFRFSRHPRCLERLDLKRSRSSPFGESYQDLGATITGPTDADKNLGLKYFLNGELVSDIVIDTSAVATDTIDYVAIDPAGLTATTTRTVIIEAASAPQ